MNRREFLSASATAAAIGAAGVLPLAGSALAAEGQPEGKKDIYELRLYKVDADARLKRTFTSDVDARRKRLDEYMAKALIPALNRLGIARVGAFEFRDGPNKDVYLLLTHPDAASVTTTTARLVADKKFMEDGAAFLDLPQNDPLYTRIESTMMLAFDDWPKLAKTDAAAARIFQMRIYEGHSMVKALKKVEMFNAGGEIDLFIKCGLKPVFFGESMAGPILPNLTYMVSFADVAEQKASWAKFIASPEWKKLSTDPQYKDTVSHIINLELKPTSYSQV